MLARIVTLKQLQSLVDACLLEPGEHEGYPCERKSEAKVRQALGEVVARKW